MNPRPKVPGGRLFLPPAVAEAALSPRQKIALAVLREHPDGLTAYDLGREVHDRYGTHMEDGRDCPYCSRAGGELAQALKRCGHVSQHRGGIYRAVPCGRGSAASPAADDEPFDWKGFGDAA